MGGGGGGGVGNLLKGKPFHVGGLRVQTSPFSLPLRLLQTFAGVLPCPLEKNSYARHFKGKHGKLYIVGKLNKCRFRKNVNCQFF